MSNHKKLHILDAGDGSEFALWEISKRKNALIKKEAVFLSHGAFSDKTVCMGIADYLVNHGYICFILEWRGHGTSPETDIPFNFETVALYEYKAAFHYIYHHFNIASLHCVTHSGGGLCLTMFLINYPEYLKNIQSITFIACQAFGAVNNSFDFIKVFSAKLVVKGLGQIPANKFKLGRVNETYYTMKPWFNWNLKKNFMSEFKNIDYKKYMSSIGIPIYSISGTGDKFIAPVHGCYKYLQAFENKNNIFREFGISKNNLEDYSHSRIALSQNAAKEVWPTILQWIDKHSQQAL
ncbi:alpha/beta fold hydrolase [Acinetobacter oleivorans]|uniref:alpha/beta fold hydrolase n=1 Tax=Acinetobacter oleivorans TaxID=1148157 RepID=UPI001900A686|nr:alpha/beta fold hydrolase [Acinetobacter oleivorans]MBJ8497929.1 alpha/beta fold hydrolase [Acinetobacter oleivorans]